MRKYEKYLPIGTVLILKESNKKVMIIGFLGIDKEEKEKVYDYIGCLYPEGMIDTGKNLLFNHSQIDKIYYFGYQDNEEKEFKRLIEDW